ncbi:MAG: hypothetical protein HY962_14235 [Ignavibacteriae bacterium]|nr:hypothetical protein [Ignavibacteriota bacterium]
MKAVHALLALVTIAALTGMAPAPEPSDLMKKKTEHAQNILRQLALADLKAVKAEAEALERLVRETGFEKETARYAEYGREFLRIVKELEVEAGKQNMAGSYYQFTRMTSVCFSCHEHIRGS